MEMPNGSDEMRQMRAPVEHNFMVKGKQVVLEKQNIEWDLNEWKWDENLFIAERRSFSNAEVVLPTDAVGKAGKAVDERRKLPVLKDDEFGDGDASLTLKLGGEVRRIEEREDGSCEDKSGKRVKSQSSLLNHPICQVDDCNVNLNGVRVYHRRHKVCETHAKSTNVLLGGVLQRFCQQCSRQQFQTVMDPNLWFKTPAAMYTSTVQLFKEMRWLWILSEERFHLLQEFDEEKRSCRRRLAGHNRRRRKNTLDTIVSDHPIKDDQASRYILFYLLKILTNLQSKNSDHSKDQDLLIQLLRTLSSPKVITEPEILSAFAHLLSQTSTEVCAEKDISILSESLRVGALVPEISAIVRSTAAASSSISSQDHIMDVTNCMPMNVARPCQLQVPLPTHNPLNEIIGSVPLQDTNAVCPIGDGPPRMQSDACYLMPSKESKVGEQNRTKINDFDLNSSYNESQDCREGSEKLSQNDWKIPQIGHYNFPSWPNQDIPQTCTANSSGNSESTSDKSRSSSGEDLQCCTDQIIFKLFGKDPSDLPHVLRAQIQSWLSHSPTDIESHIKPGCLVLTIYMRLSKHAWEELSNNLTSSLKRLLEASDNNFWRTGWICAKVGLHLAFIYDGQVLLDMPLPSSQDAPSIISVTPVAVDLSEESLFTVKGWNLGRTTTKLLCAFRGKQIVQEIGFDTIELNGSGSSSDSSESLDGYNEETQTLCFTCSFSKTVGRGFIEVEDHGLGSGFFPFIVAEQEICSELRTLEIIFTSNEMSSRNQVIQFLMEFGWLLERSHLISRPELTALRSTEFSSVRFKWLLEFSIDHDWCAVVKKILDIVFDRRVGGPDLSVDQLLNEVTPLHRAVRRNCRPMVDFLLKYSPEEKRALESSQEIKFSKQTFKSNKRGPAGITPLHIAASIEGADDVLNLLTDDPEQEWVQTWEKDRDESGFTPENYARQRGHDKYIDLVQRKKTNKASPKHLILDLSSSLPATRRVEESLSMSHGTFVKQKHTALNVDSRSMEQFKCRACEQMSVYRSGHRFLNYRPAFLSMVAIAAVCVCVGLLLKSPPEVLFVVAFRWELIDYGYM